MPLKTHRDEQPTLNLTPMIDIVFLLIIFFMVGTKFTELERKIGLKVPEVAHADVLTDAPKKKIVNVYRDGHVTLNRKTVTLEELTNRLAAARSQYKDLGVQVRGDGVLQFQIVMDVIAACKKAGIAEMAFSVRMAKRRK